MPLLRRLLPVVAVLLVGCDDARGIPGLWTGVMQLPGLVISFSVTLTETEQGVVSGGGRLINTIPGVTTSVFAATVTGAHAHPVISLAIVPSGASTMNFSGTIDPTLSRMDGVLYGSGFSGDSLHLLRTTPPAAAQITAP